MTIPLTNAVKTLYSTDDFFSETNSKYSWLKN